MASRTLRAIVLAVLAVLVALGLAACGGGSDAAQATFARPDSGCDFSFPVRVVDSGFPADLVVCHDLRTTTRFRVVNGTDSVWTVRSSPDNVFMIRAEPAGTPSARVSTFRALLGIAQSGPVSRPYRWVIEPGTGAILTPGIIDGVLEVDAHFQGAWSSFLAFEKVAQKAGSTVTEVVRKPSYRTAGQSCLKFGFSAFDRTPQAPKDVQTLIAQLRVGAQGAQCVNDLDFADRLRNEEVRVGKTALRPINGQLLKNELSESAAALDRGLEFAGKLVKYVHKP